MGSMGRASADLDARFAMGERIASGGMADVYEALDRRTGRRVAAKVVEAQDAEQTRSFWREARILAQIRHPNVVEYVGHGRLASGRLVLVTEWLEGETLEQRLARGELDATEAVALVHRAAVGLAQAHARRVVHCDLKPSNLFLVGRSPSRVKVLDFGIARLADHRSVARAGTPGYMAPEQWLGSGVDARTDVYALGCILFRCLTGRAPFPGSLPAQILYRMMIEGTPNLGAVRRDLPRGLCDLVNGMLARDPAARPTSAAVVGSHLSQWGRRVRAGTLQPARAPAAPVRLAAGTLPSRRDDESDAACSLERSHR
jgi:serine/threonine protein kinase